MALLASLAAAVVSMAGCHGQGEAIAVRDRARATATALEKQEAELAEAAAALGSLAAAGDGRAGAARADLEGVLSRVKEKRRAAEAAARQSERLILSGRDRGGSGGEAGEPEWARSARDAAGWLPEPLRLPAIMGVGLVAAIARAAQLKRSARSIAAGLDRAMRADDGLREALARNAEVLTRAQTRTAQRIVAGEGVSLAAPAGGDAAGKAAADRVATGPGERPRRMPSLPI